MDRCKQLRELLNNGNTLIMPDAYDPISARIIERLGYPAVQCSGGSYAISAGYHNEADVTYQDNLAYTRRIVQSVNIPVMADGEDGYGDSLSIPKTIRDFIAIGAAGINIEDQIIDSSAAPRIVGQQDMIDKIRAAREAKYATGNPNFIINARTDALKVTDDRAFNRKQAIERANAYLQAGADLVFVAYASTLEEVMLLKNEIAGPLSIAAGMPYNMHEFSLDDLIKLNLTRISLPMLMINSAVQGMLKSLRSLKETNGFGEIIKQNLVCNKEDMLSLQAK